MRWGGGGGGVGVALAKSQGVVWGHHPLHPAKGSSSPGRSGIRDDGSGTSAIFSGNILLVRDPVRLSSLLCCR